MTSMNSAYPSADYRTQAPAATLGSLLSPGSTPVPSNIPTPAPTLGATLGQMAGANQGAMNLGLNGFAAQANVANETASTKFFLEFVQLQETPEYLDHYNRHYIPSANTDGAIGDLAEDVARARGVPGASVLAGHASNIFGLNMAGGLADRIHVPGGWGSKRMKFLMLVREEDLQFRQTRMTYINGFTDHFGISTIHGGTSIDENMVFYINSLVTLKEENHVNPETGMGQKYWNVVQATQVVDGQLVGMDPSGRMNDVSMLRPSDLIAGFSSMTEQDVGISGWFTVDGQRGNAGGAVSQFNNMSNNLPTSYLNRLLTPIVNGLSGVGARPGIGGLSSSMSGIASQNEFTLNNCAFLRYMSKSTGMPLTTRFDMRMLSKLDATIGQRTKHFPIQQASYANINAMSLDSTPWSYAGIETEIATKLVAIIPSLMWECFAQSASFSFTNATPNHFPLLSFDYLQWITPTGLPGFQTKLENAILNSILVDITRHNQFTVSVKVFVDVSGEIRLEVSYEGQKPVSYTSPAFGCGILNPVHTNNQTVANNVVSGFGKIVDAIQTVRSSEMSGSAFPSNFNF